MNPTLNARGGINRTSNRESQGLVASGSTGTADTLISPTTAINSSSLAPQPSFVLPPTPTPTKGANLTGLIEAQTTQQTEQQKQDLAAQEAAKAASAESAKTQSFQDYIQSTLGTPGRTELTAQLYNQEGVDASKLEVNQLNNQILAEQNALRRQFEALDKANPEGLSAKGIQDRKNALEKESLSKQADLAILQMAAQGRYDSAKEIADRAIEAQLEKDKQQNEALRFIYEENKELFNKSEQRAFDIMLADRERALDQEEADKKLVSSLSINALENGAPPDVAARMQKAKDAYEAMQIGGQFVNKLNREQIRASTANSWSSYNLNQLKLQNEQAKQKQIQDSIDRGDIVLDDAQKDIAFKISKEYEGESGEFKKQVGAYNRIIASAKDPSAAGDLALIFNYMKMLDPGSTVREGEFATAQNAAGVPDRIRAQMNSVLNGERLSESTRNDFVDRSTSIYSTSLDQQIELENRYRDQATKLFGLPENAADIVIQDIRAVGSTSDVAFGIQIDNLSLDQRADLISKGLLPAYNQ